MIMNAGIINPSVEMEIEVLIVLRGCLRRLSEIDEKSRAQNSVLVSFKSSFPQDHHFHPHQQHHPSGQCQQTGASFKMTIAACIPLLAGFNKNPSFRKVDTQLHCFQWLMTPICGQNLGSRETTQSLGGLKMAFKLRRRGMKFPAGIEGRVGYIFPICNFFFFQLRLLPLPAIQQTPVRFLGLEDPLEKGRATHSSILGLPW